MNYQLIKIGRSGDNDIKLSHASVSRHHAEIFVDADGNVFVRDLKSSNGTFVNDVRIEGGKELKPGDTLRVGVEDLVEWQKMVPQTTVEKRKITGDLPPPPPQKTNRKQLAIILSCATVVLIGVGFFAYKSFFVPSPIPAPPQNQEPTVKSKEISMVGLQEATIDELNNLYSASVTDFKGDTIIESKVISGEQIFIKGGKYTMHKFKSQPADVPQKKGNEQDNKKDNASNPKKEKDNTSKKQSDQTYTVKDGDTLDNIAAKYNNNGCKVTKNNIMDDNGLNDEKIKKGEKLIIKCH